MSDNTLRLELSLGYEHGQGALADYFRAFARGRALAGRCQQCGRTWFPPHTLCPEDGEACSALELNGYGVVMAETRTRTRLPFTDSEMDVIFVLVAMSGADNTSFGRLVNFAGLNAVGERVRLCTVDHPSGHPAQAAVFQIVEDN